ncbi:MAG: Crp/Fnr family transcriptional regulator, partial [Nitrospira sp.]|nr:Crp/Fnr family transcriptional regulator [Nitrospira sp.]
IPIFKHLREAELQEIASRCKNAFYKKGDVVFYKTDLSTDLYIVISGRLKAVLEGVHGNEIVISQFEKGSFFGEFSLLDGKGRSATIVADDSSEIAILERDVFLDLLRKDSKIAVELMVTLVERLRKADEMIESLAFLEVSERLMKIFLDVAQGEGKKDSGCLRIKRLTHRELAARIGSSREAVSKCMKMLTSKGLVKEIEGYILITRQDGMKYL